MRLTAFRDNQQARGISPSTVHIPDTPEVKPYNFCLLSRRPADVPEEYRSGMEHVGFASHHNVLSGKGLPKSIGRPDFAESADAERGRIPA